MIKYRFTVLMLLLYGSYMMALRLLTYLQISSLLESQNFVISMMVSKLLGLEHEIDCWGCLRSDRVI